jgi:hypothetical protein
MANPNQNNRTLCLVISAILLFLNTTGKSESEIDSIVHIFQQASESRDFNQCKQPDTSFAVRIETQDGCAFPGDSFQIVVSMKSPEYEIWGFNFLISYDSSLLIPMSVIPNPDYFSDSGCAWEYFNYRINIGSPFNCGPAGCPGGLIRVVGLADPNSAIHPSCWYVRQYSDLFHLKFFVKNTGNYVFDKSPLRFFWANCTDNTILFKNEYDIYDVQNILLATGGRVFEGMNELPQIDSFPTFGVPADSCFSDPNSGLHYTNRRIIDFHNGSIQLVTTCPDGIDDRGDVNLNGVSYEWADAILFAKYFLHGLEVFTINTAGQMHATDANKDGEPLMLDDFVQLVRVATGDLPKDWIFDSSLNGVNTIQHNQQERFVEYRAEQCANIIWLKFEGSIEPIVSTFNGLILHNFDGAYTYVLALSLHGYEPVSVRLFNYNGIGEIIEAQAATFEGFDIPLTIPDFATDIKDDFPQLPVNFQLHQNYPNPFNNRTVINFDLPRAENVKFQIINLLGQTVYRLEKRYSAGSHSIPWDGTDKQGQTVTSGVYYYRLTAGDFVESKKMMLLK